MAGSRTIFVAGAGIGGLTASLALAAVSAIGVIVGSVLSQYLPLEWIKRVAGAAFIVIGVLILMGKF